MVQCVCSVTLSLACMSRNGSSEIMKMEEFNEIECVNGQNKQMALGILYLKYSSRHCYPVDLAVYNAEKAHVFLRKKTPLLWSIFICLDKEDRVL